MFVEYLERFLQNNRILPDVVHDRYISFMGKNCTIRIWYDSRVQVYRDKKLIKYFKFSYASVRRYLPKLEVNDEMKNIKNGIIPAIGHKRFKRKKI